MSYPPQSGPFQNHTVIPGNKTSCQPVTYCDKNPRCAPAPKSICTDKPDGSGYTCECAPGYVDEGTDDKAGKGFVCYCRQSLPAFYEFQFQPRIPAREVPPVSWWPTLCARGPMRRKQDTNVTVRRAMSARLQAKAMIRPPASVGYTKKREKLSPEENGPQANNCTQCRPNSEICLSVGNDDSGKLKQCSCAPGYKRPEGEGYGECMSKYSQDIEEDEFRYQRVSERSGQRV